MCWCQVKLNLHEVCDVCHEAISREEKEGGFSGRILSARTGQESEGGGGEEREAPLVRYSRQRGYSNSAEGEGWTGRKGWAESVPW